jgi:hypothetical protein
MNGRRENGRNRKGESRKEEYKLPKQKREQRPRGKQKNKAVEDRVQDREEKIEADEETPTH